jgi:valyl-tRNA synthetase
MDKASNQKKSEAELYEFWNENKYFKADPSSKKTHYSLLMPPPNLTGDPHMGHAMQHAILDAIARFKRLQGYDVLLLPGVDHAGIQFEGALTKKLEKEGLRKHELGREEFLKKAWEFKEEVYKSFHGTWSVFGISADWSREVFTLESKVQEAVLAEFKTFWEQDLIYKGAYIVQWCPKCATAIEDVEMEYEERKEKLYYVNYVIEGTDEMITVATARPETIAADVAIAVYPQHPKYKKLVGRIAINPFTNTQISIIEDKRVEKDFGTGALKITPGHDMLDYQIGQDHDLPILHAIGKDGKVTALDPSLAGLKVDQARVKAAELLREKGLIEKEQEYTHSVPLCERSKNPVEPLISEEWFVKMKPLSQKAIKNLDKINFVPKNYKKISADWLKDIHDWCISRSQWWGHRIPVWYCQKCNPHHLVGKDKDMVISLAEPKKNCQTCGEHHWVQEEQVLDTWFSSGLWPMATLGWPNETKELSTYYPWDFELTAPEIKYLWIARMIMLGLWFKDEIPFKNMFYHGTLRDLQGRKMSKSLGNGVDPIDLIKQWGIDPVRMTLYSYAAPGRDPRASRQTMDERAKNFRNFGTKLRNIARFVLELKPEGAKARNEVGKDWSSADNKDDLFIVNGLDRLTTGVTKDLENFNLHLASEKIYNFVWHEFADKYIESSKNRRAEAQPTLEYVLKTCLILLHPFMPFVTEEIYQTFQGREKSIMIEAWPQKA